MTRRERVYEAMCHRETDFVPYTMDFTQDEREKVARFLGDPNFIEKVGGHICTADLGGKDAEIRPGYFQDSFGVVWNRTVDKDIGVVENYVYTEPDMSLYAFPEPDEAEIRAGVEAMVAGAGDRFRVAAIGFSMFERAWTLRGMEGLLIDMVEEPGFVDALMDKVLEYNLKALDIALEYPVDGVHFGDDWGQQQGLIMGPTHWRRFIKPRMAEMYGRARARGLLVSQHSCGDIRTILDDLADIGLSTYQTFQPEIYGLREAKDAYAGRLAFWGGISTQRLLPFAPPEEIKRVARETLAIMSEGGGYIAAPTHAMPGDIPAENAVALLEVFWEQAGMKA